MSRQTNREIYGQMQWERLNIEIVLIGDVQFGCAAVDIMQISAQVHSNYTNLPVQRILLELETR